MSFTEVETVLKTYSFEDILELNELTEEDVLCFLVEQRFIKLPDPKPVDYFNND